MSTRCQIRIEGAFDEKLTLYHHSDGYPDHIVDDVKKAMMSMLVREGEYRHYDGKVSVSRGDVKGKPRLDWQAGRAGYVANRLCAACSGFQPEMSHDFHGDIEWFYVLKLIGESHVGATVKWIIEVHQPIHPRMDYDELHALQNRFGNESKEVESWWKEQNAKITTKLVASGTVAEMHRRFVTEPERRRVAKKVKAT